MAAQLAGVWDDGRTRRLLGPLLRLAGLLLLAAAATLAIALVGYDLHDPSLNHATLGPVANPLGPAGANTADLLYQSFGLAAWLVPVAVAAWGLRLASQREHPWPWLPVLALPMALLAASAFFAGLPHPGMSVWPIRSGLGGIVGYVLLDKLELAVGVAAYLLVSLAVAMVLSMLALGASWRESAWLAGRAGAGSLWVGRRLGRVARRAGARSATVLAGQLRRQGARVGTAAAGLAPVIADRLGGLGSAEPTRLRPRRVVEPEEVDDGPDDPDLDVPDEPVPDLPRVRMRRPSQPTVDEDTDEAEELPLLAARPRPQLRAVPQPTPAPAEAPPRRPVVLDEDDLPGAPSLADAAFELPPIDLLAPVKAGTQPGLSKEQLHEISRQLETVLDDFGVRGAIVDAKPGPVVTLYELEPAPGTRAARVISLADDIARSLCALSVRVAVGARPQRDRHRAAERAPGHRLPARPDEGERLHGVLRPPAAHARQGHRRQPGRRRPGRMPHLLIAGTTGSGKSVAINAMILSLRLQAPAARSSGSS